MSDQPFIPYGRQAIDEDDIEAVTTVLKSDFLTTGPTIPAFEEALAAFTQASEAVVCGNGTQALHLACMAIGLGPGDAAIVPTLTFLATANAVRYCGAEVIFCDVDPETGLMTLDTLKAALKKAGNKNVKAVLPVHLAGQAVDLEVISSFSRERGIRVIDDACHALGALYKGRPIGDGHYSDLSTFSFHPVKAIAMGEGGAITTNNKAYAKAMRRIRHHGMNPLPNEGPWAYEMPELGYNYRASDIQCALGLSQLKKLDGFLEKRLALAALYDELLAPLAPVVLPPKRVADCRSAWHLYPVRLNFDAAGISRAEFMRALKEKGIGSQVHYIPVHTQPYYKELCGDADLPGAMAYYKNTLSLPLYPALSKQDVARVVDAIKTILA